MELWSTVGTNREQNRRVADTLSPASRASRRPSHIRIVRSVAALRRGPIDVLRRVLDIARLAVDAVLEVDLELRVLPVVVVEDLINAGRAVEPGGLPVLRQVDRNWNGRV